MALSTAHPEDRAFVRAILMNPAELTAWLVYADWLDEHEQPERAEFLRLQVKRSAPDVTQTDRFGIIARVEELRAAIDPDWLALFDRVQIEGCDPRFAFQCPKQWEQLSGTDDPNVRFCKACGENVYHCQTMKEARAHAREGHCVAIVEGLDRYHDDLHREAPATGLIRTLGILRRAPEPEPEPRRPWWKFW